MTAIHFSDIVVQSPAGEIRLEIRSPDNDPARPRPVEELPEGSPRRFWGGFQGDFVYRAWRTGRTAPLWEWRQPPDDETGPVAAWVDDDGRAVVATKHTFGSELVVFDPAGRIAGRVDVSEVLDDHDFHWTSAGPAWYECSGGRFVGVDGKRYWCVRLLSGTRVWVDAAAGKIAAPSPAAVVAAEHDERAWALRTLGELAPVARSWAEWPDGSEGRRAEDLLVAANWTGVMGVAGAADALRVLEESPMGGGHTWEPVLRRGGRSVAVRFLPLRQMAQLSLRRLGRLPSGRPAHEFFYDSDDEAEDEGEPERLAVPERPEDLEARIARVRPGTAAWDVIATLGAPDAIWGMRRDGYRYDVGLADGFTLRVAWDEEAGVVAGVERVRPPEWTVPFERERWID